MYGYGFKYNGGGRNLIVQNPLEIFGSTNLKQWINFDRDVSLDGSDITGANDLSGNDANVEQTTGANRPTLTGTLNGKNTAVFNGSTDYLTCTKTASYFNFLHNGWEGTVIVVCKTGTTSNPDAPYALLENGGSSTLNIGVSVFYDDRSSLTRNDQLRVNVARGSSGTTSVSAGSDNSLPANTWSFIRVEIDADTGATNRSKRYLDGTLQTQTNVQTNSPSGSNATAVMNYGRTSSGALYLDGEIAEIIVLDRHMTWIEGYRLQNYFFKEWGLGVAQSTTCDCTVGSGLPHIVYDGNSIPNQASANLLTGFTNEYGAPGVTYNYNNITVGGKTLLDMYNDYPDVLKAYLTGTDDVYYVIHELRNQLVRDSATVNNTFTLLKELCQTIHCCNPNAKTIVIQASASVDGAGVVMTSIPSINSLIGADTSGDFDLVIDLYNYSDVNGAFNDTLSGLYEADRIHPSADGETAIGNFITSEIATAYPSL